MENVLEQTERTPERKRARSGTRAGIVGIFLNLALAASKIVAGVFTGLVSVVADGLNNLSDCGGGIISVVSFRISEKPADKEHPFGHRRAEYIASMMISFLVLLVGVELFRESIDSVASGKAVAGNLLVFATLGASLAVKTAMAVYFGIVGRRLNADALRAASTDAVCDCVVTTTVLISAVLSRWIAFPLDGWAGLLVALFIIWQGIGILREAGSKLLGQAPDPSFVKEIEERVRAGEGVLGLHDLKVFGYGPNKYFASVHIEMDANVPVLLSHDRIDAIERDFAENTDVMLTAHLDPVDMSDEKAIALGERVREAVRGIDGTITVHDFRVVWGKISKVIFDVCVPYECRLRDGDVGREIERVVREMGDYEPIVTVERG